MSANVVVNQDSTGATTVIHTASTGCSCCTCYTNRKVCRIYGIIAIVYGIVAAGLIGGIMNSDYSSYTLTSGQLTVVTTVQFNGISYQITYQNQTKSMFCPADTGTASFGVDLNVNWTKIFNFTNTECPNLSILQKGKNLATGLLTGAIIICLVSVALNVVRVLDCGLDLYIDKHRCAMIFPMVFLGIALWGTAEFGFLANVLFSNSYSFSSPSCDDPGVPCSGSGYSSSGNGIGGSGITCVALVILYAVYILFSTCICCAVDDQETTETHIQIQQPQPATTVTTTTTTTTATDMTPYKLNVIVNGQTFLCNMPAVSKLEEFYQGIATQFNIQQQFGLAFFDPTFQQYASVVNLKDIPKEGSVQVMFV